MDKRVFLDNKSISDVANLLMFGTPNAGVGRTCGIGVLTDCSSKIVRFRLKQEHHTIKLQQIHLITRIDICKSWRDLWTRFFCVENMFQDIKAIIAKIRAWIKSELIPSTSYI